MAGGTKEEALSATIYPPIAMQTVQMRAEKRNAPTVGLDTHTCVTKCIPLPSLVQTNSSWFERQELNRREMTMLY